MKLVFPGIAILTLTFAPLTPAEAETCGGRAQACVVKWGAPRSACYEPFRLSACEQTGRYVAPNGNVWPTGRAGKKIDVED
jgi:hypothetical protein